MSHPQFSSFISGSIHLCLAYHHLNTLLYHSNNFVPGLKTSPMHPQLLFSSGLVSAEMSLTKCFDIRTHSLALPNLVWDPEFFEEPPHFPNLVVNF